MTYPYVSGAVLLASDLNTDFAAKSDTAPAQNTQTGTGASAYTFVLADASRLTVANAATAATYTIPPAASVTWVANTIINVASIGAGTITFAAGAGVTVTNTAGTLSQYQSAMLVRTALNAWTVVPFAGGASLLKSSDVSATTGSPTITTSGGFTIYQFTGSGSITLGKAGLCSLLVIGGGGSGGRGSTYYNAGGGGAGGYLEITGYLDSGLNTVIIGAGGVGGGASIPNTSGVSSRIGSFYGVGGGNGAGATNDTNSPGDNGGSGGGGGSTGASGAGMSGQGNNGGSGSGAGTYAGGGGGGAGAVGANAGTNAGGNGGNGTASSITGSSVTRGGGGGGTGSSTYGTGGTGGGGAAALAAGTAGTANTGGGGGGSLTTGGNGGSGIVIVKVVT